MTQIPLEPSLPHDETSSALLTTLRNLAQTIPGFAYVSPERRRRINVTASVPDQYLQALAVACEASPLLATSCELTVEELRNIIAFSRAYLAVAEELELLAYAIRGTVAEHRFAINNRALRAYGVAKSLNRRQDAEQLIPHLISMREALGRSGPKRKTPAPDAPPAGKPPGKPAEGGAPRA